MKIVGKNKTVYEYESSGRVKEPDGTAYPLKNRRGYMVKLLDSVYCTKQREQEISGALSSGNTWHGLRIMDMVYSHGKFAGVYTRRHRSLSPPRHLGDPEAQGEVHICLQEADLTLPLHRDQKSLPLQDTPEEGMIPETEGMLLLPGEVLTVWRIWAL